MSDNEELYKSVENSADAAAEEADEQSLLDVFYRLLAFEPFRAFLQPKNNAHEDRPIRNLAAF